MCAPRRGPTTLRPASVIAAISLEQTLRDVQHLPSMPPHLMHLVNLKTCLPPEGHSDGATALRSASSAPSPLPHLEHLPNRKVCAPPLGHLPDSDSIADAALSLFEVASPGARGTAPAAERGLRHFGHSSLPYLSSHECPQYGHERRTSFLGRPLADAGREENSVGVRGREFVTGLSNSVGVCARLLLGLALLL